MANFEQLPIIVVTVKVVAKIVAFKSWRKQFIISSSVVTESAAKGKVATTSKAGSSI